jgi:hypothetical protein
MLPLSVVFVFLNIVRKKKRLKKKNQKKLALIRRGLVILVESMAYNMNE